MKYDNDYFEDIVHWNTAHVTNMSEMFMNAVNFNQPIGKWDVSNVTNMTSMFEGASKFNAYIEDWDTSRVTTMERMFCQATSFDQELDEWDVSNVTNMTSMFEEASKFNRSLENWELKKIQKLDRMFQKASAFNMSVDFMGKYIKDDWREVTCEYMFTNATRFYHFPDWLLIKYVRKWGEGEYFWHLSYDFISDGTEENDYDDVYTAAILVKNYNNYRWRKDYYQTFLEMVFYGTPLESFVKSKRYIAKEKPSEDANESYSYSRNNCSIFNNLLSKAFNEDINVTRTNAKAYFRAINKYFGGDGSDSNIRYNRDRSVTISTPEVGDINIKFNIVDRTKLKIKEISGISGTTPIGYGSVISSIKEVPALFTKVDKLFGFRKQNKIKSKYKPKFNNELRDLCGNPRISLKDIDVSEVSDFSSAFENSNRTNEQFEGIENWNMSKATKLTNMFKNATHFNRDINHWNVSNVTDMGGMFNGATSFNQPLNKWDVSKVESFHSMFRDAVNFNQDISRWNISSLDNMAFMFKGATSFNQPIGRWKLSDRWRKYHCSGDVYQMFYNASSFNQDLSSWVIGYTSWMWNSSAECRRDLNDTFTGCPIKEEYKMKFNSATNSYRNC